MALYPRRRSGTDAYAPARALFDALITQLSDPEMAARPEHIVEEFITGDGREVLKQVMQDHLDARAAAEPRLPDVTGTDQVVRRRAEPGHIRLLATTLGRVEVTRIAYRAPAASNLHPGDAGWRCRPAGTRIRCNARWSTRPSPAPCVRPVTASPG